MTTLLTANEAERLRVGRLVIIREGDWGGRDSKTHRAVFTPPKAWTELVDRVVPLYTERRIGSSVELTRVGRGSIEVVPVVHEDDNRHLDPPFLEVAPSDRCVYWMPDVQTLTALYHLDPLPVPGKDFGIVIDCVELV